MPVKRNGQDAEDPSWYREDGSLKGMGFLGALPIPGTDSVATEFSIADSDLVRDPKTLYNYADYPSLVPTLTPEEIQQVLHAAATKGPLSDAIKQKAEAFALQRRAQGKPVFADLRESPLRIGDTMIDQPPLAVSHVQRRRD
jgi:hypothetical protein